MKLQISSLERAVMVRIWEDFRLRSVNCSFLLMTINYLKADSQGRCPRPKLGQVSAVIYAP